MKKWIWRASAGAFAAALAGTMACGSTSGCGGTNINSNAATSTVNNVCGVGTYLNSANQCVPTAASSTSGGSSTQLNTTSN